jgi:hypothetical protein
VAPDQTGHGRAQDVSEPADADRRQRPEHDADGVTTNAMMIEFFRASITSGSEKTCWYHLVVNPDSGSAMMIESLNEKTTRIKQRP